MRDEMQINSIMRSFIHNTSNGQVPKTDSTFLLAPKVVDKNNTSPNHTGAGEISNGKPTGEAGYINDKNSFNFSNIPILPNHPVSVQTKLTINTPGDKYEQEADRMADQVMKKENTSSPNLSHQNVSLQRKCAACEKDEDKVTLMRKNESNGGMLVDSSVASQLNSSKAEGMPLPAATKGFMEDSFGTSFSRVRIHADSKAAEMNKGIQAKAFTYGPHIYFNQGEYNPDTRQGKRLLVHELTHTLQQEKGLSRQTLQREGEEKKPDKKKEVKTKVEVVTEHDFSEEKTKTKATTTRSAEESIGKGVTATATEKTSEEGKSGSAEFKAKDKSTGLSVTGGIKAESPSDPTKADSAKGFIKVGGQWTFFDSRLKLETGLSSEFDFKKTPKISADGKVVFLPNGVVTPELAAKMVYSEKGVTGKIDPSLSFRITETLSAKAGVPIEIGPDRKLKAGIGVGIVLKF